MKIKTILLGFTTVITLTACIGETGVNYSYGGGINYQICRDDYMECMDNKGWVKSNAPLCVSSECVNNFAIEKPLHLFNISGKNMNMKIANSIITPSSMQYFQNEDSFKIMCIAKGGEKVIGFFGSKIQEIDKNKSKLYISKVILSSIDSDDQQLVYRDVFAASGNCNFEQKNTSGKINMSCSANTNHTINYTCNVSNGSISGDIADSMIQ